MEPLSSRSDLQVYGDYATLPVAGVGSEVWAWVNGWCWCGRCGYTGRVKGPRQAACPEWMWHAWLAHCAEMEMPWPERSEMEAARA